jgi:ATP-dependent helicase/nuclease subunit B
MPNPAPRVFTIPASAPFLPTLIAALVEGRLVPGFPGGRDPLTLNSATLYLPTRRAGRLAHDLFLDALGADAAVLPRIVVIGDIDEDEIAFAEAATGDLAAEALALPEALGGLERRLLLTELVLKWATAIRPTEKGQASLVASTPAAALALADDLARLLDDMTTRGVPWENLDGLVPDHLDQYWQLTLRLLQIAREAWPALLAERGMIEPAARRDRLIKAEAKRLAQAGGPVIAAGSTGSIPATAELIAAVAKLPQGAVVLPGLDTDLDEASWALIAGSEDGSAPAAGHPQYAMQALLTRIGLRRDGVKILAPPSESGRERLLSEAFRPAASTELWRDRVADAAFAAQAESALENLSVVEAANAEEEALAIAIALREAAAEADKTAVLVTPDRALARRVLAALARWKVPVDDSGGDRFPDTPAGLFARLAAEAALGGLEPVTLLALLKHPLLRLGADENAQAHAAAALEYAILRGPRPKRGTSGIAHALATFRSDLGKLRRGEQSELHRSDPRARMADADLDAAASLIARLAAALAPLEDIPGGVHSFADLTARHSEVIAALSADGAGMSAALAGIDGTALADVFEKIAESRSAPTLRVTLSDYPDLFHNAISDRIVRRPGLPGVRVRILGPLEARLTTADRVVLGGLVEGTWPPETRSDAWLSRPMRHQLGLDLPERRIGLSAHDFVQMLGAKDVILTRAAKLAGVPTVASRFVQRLAAVAGERWKAALERGAHYAALARKLDDTVAAKPAERPAPRPPFAARPRQLSVTEIEHWLRDPYTIYAKHVLKLSLLDGIDTPPGASDRGTLIHDSIGEFAKTFPQEMPEDPVAAMKEIGARHFAPLSDYPEARAFWWPRFLRIAEWFARFETVRRAKLSRFDAEIGGSVVIPFGDGEFKLTVRADRIECLSDGRYAILDYKTGIPPTEKQVRTGLSPQLTLEAAILRKGGFKAIPANATVAELLYVRLSGGAKPGEEKPIAFESGTADEHADHALARLTGLLAKFADPASAYYSLVHPMWTTHYGTYDHLARVQEWSLTGGAGEGGAGE